jgi:HNH endonuclease
MSDSRNVACDICESHAVRVRFFSRRVAICQRCVTFLCNTQIQVDILYRSIEQVATRLAKSHVEPGQESSQIDTQPMLRLMTSGAGILQTSVLRTFELECIRRKTSASLWKPKTLRRGDLARYLRALNKHLVSGTELSIRPADWKALRLQIVRDDRFQCQICERGAIERHVHHIVPLSRFGTNDANNLITLCARCHTKQHPDIEMRS